jgi:2-succinyl-5-enolpyruvyl-6-hydroxy-3-cyclohexene-1-carboxylate synthase
VNPSTQSARAVVDALIGQGVQDVVLCPGSRSAPLAYALHAAELAGQLRLHVRYDERSAAFCALGLGKAGGFGKAGRRAVPAAVVTTSGTAVANLHPAVLEAHHADVPLLVVTADRPHSLRGTWANQTSDLQAGLFAGAVRFTADLPASSGDPRDAERWQRAVVDGVRAARGTGGRRPGPAHLDLAFDDPLPPALPDSDWHPGAAAIDVPRPPSPARSIEEPHWLTDDPRTVVVAGDGAGWEARWLAEAGGWPLLAEPSSHARSGPNAVGPYRLLLGRPELGGLVQRVVVLGRPTLSRPVGRLLARLDVEVVLVAPHPEQAGPGRPVTRLVSPPVPEWLRDEGKGFYRRPLDEWSSAWITAGAPAQRAVDRVVDEEAAAGRMTGPLVAREVAAALDASPGERLVSAASNPIRDLDLAAHPFSAEWFATATAAPGVDDEAHRRVLANRGLSGIDGTISTAVGVALASRTHVRALVGDLAFLHDLAGLAVPAAERSDLHLQVVVLNDDGGGIFTLLEHGEPQRAQHFERVFGTPHGADLSALCAGFGIRHSRADDVPALRSALGAVPRGISVLEVPADRTRLRQLHEQIRSSVEVAVEPVLEGLVEGSLAT